MGSNHRRQTMPTGEQKRGLFVYFQASDAVPKIDLHRCIDGLTVRFDCSFVGYRHGDSAPPAVHRDDPTSPTTAEYPQLAPQVASGQEKIKLGASLAPQDFKRATLPKNTLLI